MNFIQKNPNDPKYQEFHDGEYEFWPADGTAKHKSISIPAAVASGLEMVAAAAAAGLAAIALTVLYVTASPLTISETAATINTNIYNNTDDQSIVYTLTPAEDPELILQEGTLQEDESTLQLEDLAGGTTYDLTYYDSEGKKVGHFRFTTPGPQPDPVPSAPAEPPAGSEPSPGIPAETQPPAESQPTETVPTEPAPTQTPPAQTEPAETTAPEEVPPYNPPAPAPKPDPKPEETKPEETEPEAIEPAETEPVATEPEETEPEETDPSEPPATEPEPEPVTPDLSGLHYGDFTSGIVDPAHLGYTQTFIFKDVPDERFELRVEQDGKTIEDFRTEYYEGVLWVYVDGVLYFGDRYTTTVTVTTSDGRTLAQRSVLAPPKLESAAMRVEKTAEETYVFTVTARVAETNAAEEMILQAELLTHPDTEYLVLDMTQDPVDPTLYSVTTEPITVTEPGEKYASAIVSGYWRRINAGIYTQAKAAEAFYN